MVDNSIYAIYDDSIRKFYVDGTYKILLKKENIYDFSFSPNEHYASVFANDSLFVYNLDDGSNQLIYISEKILWSSNRFTASLPSQASFTLCPSLSSNS